MAWPVTPHLTLSARISGRRAPTSASFPVAQKPANVDDPEAHDLYRIAQADSVIPADAGRAFRTMSV
jgi:hypothetical protein